jgi:type 1 glutamine amidotransferase
VRKVAGLLAVAVLLAGCGHAAPGPAPSDVRVLVFSKTAGYRHNSIPDGIAAIRAVSGFAVDATEDAGAFTTANLSRYRAVVFLSTTGDVLDDAQQTAFEGYVRGGGGYVGVHSATDTEYDWPFYGELVGTWFKEHTAVQPGRVVVVDRTHPATAHLGVDWSRTDEWYSFRAVPHAHVLLEYDGHAIAWCHPVGKGRSIYTAMGHTKESFAEPAFRQHLLGAIRWAAGLAAGRCTDESPAAAATGLSLPGPGEAPDFYLYSGNG